ncbi:hypothetical protein LSCM1_02799 [Leishmania martiniquensis]|uniref:Uncharacterized protein n=1 Tax=Leishmania martiniquensis TaxID=1580590 RepID=A0A836GA98_9TRYP|nr:hypothetical protein LSCM1_02799 [Leishmania martiniquensis]
MFSAAVTDTASASVGPLQHARRVSRYGISASGELCVIRQRKSSACDKTCAIILGCVLGGCAVVLFFIVMWCFLAAKRRREQQRRKMGVACHMRHLYTPEEEAVMNENSLTVPAPVTVERGVLPRFLSANAYSPASPFASSNLKSDMSYPHKNVSAADSSGSGGAVVRGLCTHIPIVDGQALSLSERQPNPLAPQVEEPQPNDAPQEARRPPATTLNRRSRLPRKKHIRGVSAVACPEDSASSIEDHLV